MSHSVLFRSCCHGLLRNVAMIIMDVWFDAGFTEN